MDTFRKLLDNGMTEKENENIFPLSKLHKQMPLTFTRHGVNWLLRNKSKNGFDKVLYKIGRIYYVNLHDVQRWIESKRVE